MEISVIWKIDQQEFVATPSAVVTLQDFLHSDSMTNEFVMISARFENKTTNQSIYFNYQKFELFKTPHCPEMIQHSCANEAKYSNASHLAPQLSRLQALHPGPAFSQPAGEEKSE